MIDIEVNIHYDFLGYLHAIYVDIVSEKSNTFEGSHEYLIEKSIMFQRTMFYVEFMIHRT